MLRNKIIFIFLILICSVNAELSRPPFRNYRTFEEWQEKFFKYYYDYNLQIPTDPTFWTRSSSAYLNNEIAINLISNGILAHNSGTPYKVGIGTALQFIDSTLSVKQSEISHLNISDIGINNHVKLDAFKASKGQASGLAELNASSKVVQDPANATATPTANKIPISDTSGTLDSWVSINIDGGSPSSVYLATQSIDGGTP